MTVGLAGRALATAGIVCGLLTLAFRTLSFAGFSSGYAQDGTAAAFLIAALALSSHFPAEIDADLRGAAQGAAAFGFLLFVPAHQAFDQLDTLDAGGWLGLCTALIPIGLLMVHSDRAHRGAATPRPALVWTDPGPLVAAAGIVLIVVGVWLDVDSGGPSYWSSSHTLGILMLLAAAANLLLLPRLTADAALLVGAGTFGLVAYAWIYHAFENLGSLGPGGWMEALGAVALIGGVTLARRARLVSAAAASPAVAQ